jgi:hypothetical protein
MADLGLNPEGAEGWLGSQLDWKSPALPVWANRKNWVVP